MIRFMLTEVPATRSVPACPVEPVIDDLLPWADPYIVKLAQALEREAREQLEAAFAADDAEDDSDDDLYLDSDFGRPGASRFPSRI